MTATRPWHVLLSPAVPIIALLNGNPEGAAASAAVRPLAWATCSAVVGWYVVGRLSRNSRGAALAVSVVGLVGLSQVGTVRLLDAIHLRALLPLVPLLLVVLAAWLLQVRKGLEVATFFMNVLVGGLLFSLLWTTLGREAARTDAWAPAAVEGSVVGAPHPDVYIIVLDAYGRQDVLRQVYQYEGQLEERLRTLGYVVADSAVSNYGQTLQSIGSSLNLEYLQALVPRESRGDRDRRALAELATHNRLFSSFRAAGYRVVVYPSAYSPLRPGPADRRPVPLVPINSFDFGLYLNTPLPVLSVMVGADPFRLPLAAHRRQLLWTLERLQRDFPKRDDPPVLTFVHLLTPHPPFAFDARGDAPQPEPYPSIFDAGDWFRTTRESRASYRRRYADVVQFISRRVGDLAESLERRADGRKRIVVIQSDHGPGSGLDLGNIDTTDVRERFGILFAVRIPGLAPSGRIYPTISPINGMREVVNLALGTRLSRLPDESFYSSWSEPWRFIRVPEKRLRGVSTEAGER